MFYVSTPTCMWPTGIPRAAYSVTTGEVDALNCLLRGVALPLIIFPLSSTKAMSMKLPWPPTGSLYTVETTESSSAHYLQASLYEYACMCTDVRILFGQKSNKGFQCKQAFQQKGKQFGWGATRHLRGRMVLPALCVGQKLLRRRWPSLGKVGASARPWSRLA